MDESDLSRFVEAQEPLFAQALAEIRAGEKRSHWMWFVFPQMRGLGQSAMAWRYGIASSAQARAYLAHPLLGERLRSCVTSLQALPTMRAEQVFGAVDAMKLRSSLTLFEAVAGDREPLFEQALERWFGGERDSRTLNLLRTP